MLEWSMVNRMNGSVETMVVCLIKTEQGKLHRQC